MTIRGIAFDLEGTSIDVEAAHHGAHLSVAAEQGLTLSYEEACLRIPHLIGGPDDKIYEDLLALLPEEVRGRVSIAELLARKKELYDQHLTKIEIKPRPGFEAFVRDVREMGIRVAIGSLTARTQAEHLLKESKLLDLFGRSHIVLREDVENLKPAPDVFLKTASVMGVSPSEQLVFEDSPRGVEAALAAGSKAIGMPVVLRGFAVGALVDAGASRVFFDWHEINVAALIRNLT
ncbi:MAG: HAD family phosphatase [Candidatus Uhrbacteria bacterium]|nr:HAD family phosphatase [Candidatus Uhrbacteria bacterium]